MWCGTIDYDDAKTIIEKLKFKKPEGEYYWVFHKLGSQNLTAIITTSHWCGQFYYLIEIYNTKGDYYHWISRNNGDYELILSEMLPKKSIEGFENKLNEIMLKFSGN